MTKPIDSIREITLGLFLCGVIDQATAEDIMGKKDDLLGRIREIKKKYIPTCHTVLEADMLQVIIDLQERLELGFAFDSDGKRVELDGLPDGIDCRDVTIEIMQQEINDAANIEDNLEIDRIKLIHTLESILEPKNGKHSKALKVFKEIRKKIAKEVLESGIVHKI